MSSPTIMRLGSAQAGFLRWIAQEIGRRLLRYLNDLGATCVFFWTVLRTAFSRPFRRNLLFQQLEFIGNQSLVIIILTGFFTGAVFGLQIGGIFQIFRAEGLMGAATGKALTRELAPLMTAFLLTGRVGSAMTAEISTMRVNEQVDAMEAMAVDPISYLVVPRFLAAIIITPFLCGVFIFIGVIGAYITGVALFDIDVGVFLEKLKWIVKPRDIWSGLEKAFIFAAIYSVLACRAGLRASGGAKGVGVATTNSVVMTLLVVLCFDVVITYLQIRFNG